MVFHYLCFFFFKQKTAYEMRISDWSSDVCSSDLALIVHQVAQYLCVVGRRKHQLRADRRRGKGNAPTVRVEHRHDRQHHAAVRHVEHVWLDLGDRVDDVRAMLVEHTLRIARRPAGIAKPRSEEHTSELQSLMR